MTGSAGPPRPTAAGPAGRVGSGARRLFDAWRVMPQDRRLAACAAIGLFLAMFLPWYQRQFFVVIAGKLAPGSDSQTAWGQFSFVEAAVLLVAAGVLTLLFQRAEGKAFHLPGGDGWVITVAGVWTCALIIWRIFDKQGGATHGRTATTYGIEWGIFVALAIAALLAYTGSRIRASHRPEPPLPGEPPEDDPAVHDPPPPPGPREIDRTEATIPRARPAPSVAPGDDDPPRERGWLTAPRRDQRGAPFADHPAPKPATPQSADEPYSESSGEPPRLWSGRRRRPPDEDPTIPFR